MSFGVIVLNAIDATVRRLDVDCTTKLLSLQYDLTFENTNSMGFKSGLYGGKELDQSSNTCDHINNYVHMMN